MQNTTAERLLFCIFSNIGNFEHNIVMKQTSVACGSHYENHTVTNIETCRYEAGEVVFTFEDDGIPFDPTQPTDSHLSRIVKNILHIVG